MNTVTERMQSAQQYLERAAHLEGTGQPKVCADYVRRAGELIEEAREDLAWQRGGFRPFVLAAERLGYLPDKVGAIVSNAMAKLTDTVNSMSRAEHTPADYALVGPSKGGGR